MRNTEARLGLLAVAGATFLLFGFGPGSCGLEAEEDDAAPVPCSHLNERGCLAEPSCEAVYADRDCASGCELDAAGERRCPETDCGSGGGFVECREAATACPEVACEMYCELGFRRGPDGCEICACEEPPPGPCASDEECPDGWSCALPDVTCQCVRAEDCDCGPTGWCVPDESVCRSDEDCEGGQSCVDGVCTWQPPACTSDDDCLEGEVCGENGRCEPAWDPHCDIDVDCGEDAVCLYNRCLPLCETDADCTAPATCVEVASCTAVGCPEPFSVCM